MSEELLHNIPPEHITKAEEVRSYLVHVRGGAPFLSGADARLLVSWLDEGISTMAINTAIERAAEKRRSKRTRSRLCLNNCRGELNNIRKKKAPTPKHLKPIINIGLDGLVQKINSLSLPEHMLTHKITLLKSLSTLSQSQLEIEKAAEKGVQACRIFHEALWTASVEEHETLRIQAEKELASLQPLLGMMHWKEMVEEVMRDKIRSRYPLISAQSIWNALNLSQRE